MLIGIVVGMIIATVIFYASKKEEGVLKDANNLVRKNNAAILNEISQRK